MYKTALVKDKLLDGSRLVSELDRGGFEVQSAFWLFDREIEDWRLILHFRTVDTETLTVAYGVIWRVMLAMHPKPSFALDEVMLLDSSSSLLHGVQSVAPTRAEAIRPHKIGPISAGDVWIEEAFVYRSALQPNA